MNADCFSNYTGIYTLLETKYIVIYNYKSLKNHYLP